MRRTVAAFAAIARAPRNTAVAAFALPSICAAIAVRPHEALGALSAARRSVVAKIAAITLFPYEAFVCGAVFGATP